MPKIKTFFKQFNWKIILIRVLVNGVTLILTVLIIPDIYFVTPTFRSVLIIAIGLGILNAIVKPIILLITGQFIFATFGLLLILVNALILYILEWLFPTILVVNSIFWALIAGAVLSLISNALENLLGLTMPIVPEENLELRKHLEAEQQASLINLVAKPQTIVQDDSETHSVSEVTAARAVLDTLQVATEPVESSSSDLVDTPDLLDSDQQLPDGSQVQASEPHEDEVSEKDNDSPKGGAA
jgi:putative membrane protein